MINKMDEMYTLNTDMQSADEYDSEATLDISISTQGASDSQLWLFAEVADLVEGNYETFVQKNLDYGSAFLKGAVREHIGSQSPFDDAMESALYRLFTRSDDKRDRFEQQVFGEGNDLVKESAKETALDAMNYWCLMAWTLEHGEEHIDTLLSDLEEKHSVIEEQREYKEETGISY